ncbi:hypothetical protein DV495_005019 [Geotrichum candidum]|nr:hypothetical protein DV495_005019 [Geotrichum candidum]KAF7500436.1 hypothetical protein DV113_001529 [Geotrichum candidum]KAI8131141.1 hypothetical protein DUD61_005196 [Geotrichum candidum]
MSKSRYYLINGEPTKEDDFVRYGASVRQPTRIDQDNLDDDDLFSHRAAPKAGLGSVADDLTSDLFPGKVALNRQERLRETAGDNNQEDEDRDIFNSLPKGPDSYRSRDRYDHERTRRNNTYGRTDRHDKWTKNSDLAARIDRGNRRFPSREDQDEAHNGEPQAPWRDSQRGGGRRHRRNNNNNNNNSSNNDQPFRSRSRSNSYSPERRNHHHPRRGNNHHRSHANREERDLGARFDEDRRSGRAWDNRDRD